MRGCSDACNKAPGFMTMNESDIPVQREPDCPTQLEPVIVLIPDEENIAIPKVLPALMWIPLSSAMVKRKPDPLSTEEKFCPFINKFQTNTLF